MDADTRRVRACAGGGGWVGGGVVNGERGDICNTMCNSLNNKEFLKRLCLLGKRNK